MFEKIKITKKVYENNEAKDLLKKQGNVIFDELDLHTRSRANNSRSYLINKNAFERIKEKWCD